MALTYYLQRVRFSYAFSKKESHCFCPLMRESTDLVHILGSSGACSCLTKCDTKNAQERNCGAPLTGTEIALNILRLLPSSTDDNSRASAIAALAGTLLDDECANKTYFVDNQNRNRMDLCLHALTLNPNSTDALSILAAIMDPSGVTKVYSNGILLTLQMVRDRLTEIRLQESLSLSRGSHNSPASKIAPLHSLPTNVPEAVRAFHMAMGLEKNGKGLCSIPSHSVLKSAIMRDVTKTWLDATAAGVACPSPSAARVSEHFQKVVDALFSGGVAAESAFGELYDMSRAPIDQNSNTTRIAASSKLYLSIGLLLQDSPFSLEEHIEALATFRKPSPPYLADAIQALAEYRAAVVSGEAFFDHTYVLAALLHEALGNGDITTILRLQGSARAGLYPGKMDEEFKALLNEDRLKNGKWRSRLLFSVWTTFDVIKSKKRDQEGKSANEKWQFFKITYAAELKEFNGGKGLTAMDDPYPDGIMSFVGLESIKLKALKFIQEEIEYKRTSVAGAGRERLNYIFEGNPGTGKTVMARLWSRLLGQLGLRPNFEEEEDMYQKLEEESKKSKATADKSALDVKLEEAEKEKRSFLVKQMEKPVEVAEIRLQCAQDNLVNFKTVPPEIQKLPAKSDASGEALKQNCINSFNQRISTLERIVAECHADLSRVKKEFSDAKMRYDEQEARANQVRAEQSIATKKASSANKALGSAPPKRFHEFKGHNLAGEADEKRRLLNVVEMLKAAKPPGGTILVDEAHNMNPSKSENGRAALLYLLTIAEDCRILKWTKPVVRGDGQCVEEPQKPGGISIIFTGYERDISEKLLSADPGLPSRFPHRITFDDYNTEELAKIFENLIKSREPSFIPEKIHYGVEKKAALALGRRLARGSGARGFGNARTVEGRMGSIIERWRERVGVSSPKFKATTENHILTMEDVMGFEPDITTGAVGAIMREMDDKFVGLAKVKESFVVMISNLKKAYYEDCLGLRQTDCGLLNRVFQGPPGTGKTNVAKLYARLLKACGFLSDGGIELTKPQDFKGSAIGQSGEKAAAIFQRSQGKVLVIDEAYGMSGDDPFNKDIVDVVVAETPDRGGVDMVVVLCGYEDLIQEMFDTSNPGLARRFPENLCRITFDPYSRKELRAIFVKSVLSMGASADFGCAEAAGLALERESAVHNFGNASAAEKFAERLLRFVRTRARNEGIFTNNELSLHATDVEDMLKSERLEDKYAGYVLNSELRDYVDKWSLEVASSRILRLPGGPWPHLVLKGYPGTGKSTSINVMARELYEKGALPTKRVKEVLGTTLQSRYVGGGTSKDVNDAFQAAQGGVLFIDEAHNLVPGGADYKRDVIASIVGCMTGKYKNKVLVVLAGYPGRMDELMATDPGLPGRFPASANLPEVGHEENVKNLKETLLHSKDLRYKSRVPSSANEILINYFTQRKKLRGENYRNRGEAELLAVDIHSKAMRRFEREAQQKANGSPTLLNNKPKTALLYLEESLNNWSSGNREYLLEDVKSSCDDMLEMARKDEDDALAHTRRGLGLKPTLPEEMNTIVAAEDKHGHQYMQHEQSQLIGKMKLQNSSSARFNQLLGPKMSQALAEEFQKSPGAYWNMLAGENNDLEKSLKETLQGFNNGLNDSDRATSDEFEAFFKNMLEEVGERLKSGNAAAYKRIEEDRKAWAHSQDDADKLRELDSNMRKNTWMLITTVTQVRTRKCGICGRNDEAGSGCAYGGSSPTPFFVTTEYFSQEQKLAFEQ